MARQFVRWMAVWCVGQHMPFAMELHSKKIFLTLIMKGSWSKLSRLAGKDSEMQCQETGFR